MLVKKVVVKDVEDQQVYALTEEQLELELGENEVLVKVKACSISSACNEKVLERISDCNSEERPFGRHISGVVESVGRNVTLFSPGNKVAGIIPLNSKFSGCATYTILSQFDLAIKPESVSHLDAACSLEGALKAYTALFYQANVSVNQTLLVYPATKSYGISLIQLAKNIGVKVLAVGTDEEELLYLQNMQIQPDAVIDACENNKNLLETCEREPSGLGVDCFCDDGVSMYGEDFKEMNPSSKLPSKNDVIRCLGVGGRWVTTQCSLQLDPPDSESLLLKCASLHFMFDESWHLSRGNQGRYSHILNDIMINLERGVLRPAIHHTVLLEDCVESVQSFLTNKIGSVAVKIV